MLMAPPGAPGAYVDPNAYGMPQNGGPMGLLIRIMGDNRASKLWRDVGWTLGATTSDMEMEFLSFGQFFNGDAFTIGDFVDRIRGKVGALKK